MPVSTTFAIGGTVTSSSLLREPLPHECPHGCGRDRHQEPLTEQVARMYDSHSFREDYSPDSDYSPIVCVGSNYHGPNRPKDRPWTIPDWSGVWVKLWEPADFDPVPSTWATYYTALWVDEPYKPPPLEPLPECDVDITVTFDDDWKPWLKAHPTKSEAAAAREVVGHITHAAIKALREFPVPERPGYDFSKYAEDPQPYYLGAKK